MVGTGIIATIMFFSYKYVKETFRSRNIIPLILAGTCILFLTLLFFVLNYHGDRIDGLATERFNLIAEYSSCVDKSEITERIEKHNQNCDEYKIANNAWLNPEALLRQYDFDSFKINIDNLKD